MKTNYLLMLFMGISLLISCSQDNETLEIYNVTTEIDTSRRLDNEETGGGISDASVDLMAGQNTDSGSVTVSDVDGLIDVTYQTEGNWTITETHLYIGSQEDMPANNPGNPRIGQFPYSGEHETGTTFVSYNDLNTIPVGECVWVAAHAVVLNTVTGQEETAWAFGEDIPGNSWAMYFEVCNN